MQDATIVPDHDIARPPLMAISARHLAGVGQQPIQEGRGVGVLHARNPIGVATDEQGRSTGHRMHLDQGA